MVSFILQAFIALAGALAVWLTFSKSRFRPWAPWLGLSAQPAWLFATFRAGDWGEFIAAIVFTVAWARGARQEGRPWKKR